MFIHVRFHVYHPLIVNKPFKSCGMCVKLLLLPFKNSNNGNNTVRKLMEFVKI